MRARRARRAAGHPRARPLAGRRAADRGHLAGHALARLRRRRPDRGRAWADLVTLDTGSVRTAGTGADEATAVFAAGAADVVSVIRDGDLVADRGRPAGRRRPGPGRSPRCGSADDAAWPSPGSVSWSRKDPSRGPLGPARDAALVVEDGRVAWVGPARAGTGGRHRPRRRRPGGRARVRRLATRTWCSPATAPRSSRPGWPGRRTPRAASAPRSPRPGPRATSSSPRTWPASSTRCTARAPPPSR